MIAIIRGGPPANDQAQKSIRLPCKTAVLRSYGLFLGLAVTVRVPGPGRWKGDTMRASELHFPYLVESVNQLPVRAVAAIRLHQAEQAIHSITVFPPQHYSTIHLGWLSAPWIGLRKTPRRTVVLDDHQAIIVAVDRGGHQTTRIIPYAALIDIELALMILYAYVQFTWMNEGQAETVKIEFNAVRTAIIREQLDWLRDMISVRFRYSVPCPEGELGSLLGTALGKLRDYLRAALLPTEPLLMAVYQSALRRSKGRARSRGISPNRIVAFTDRHLILVEEESTPDTTYGAITRFCPLACIQFAAFESGSDTIRMQVARGTAQATHEIEIPLSQANAAVLRDWFGKTTVLPIRERPGDAVDSPAHKRPVFPL